MVAHGEAREFHRNMAIRLVAWLCVALAAGIAGYALLAHYGPAGGLNLTLAVLIVGAAVELGALGIVILAIRPPDADASTVKPCPDCAEFVRAEARVCRYCRHQFSAAAAVTA